MGPQGPLAQTKHMRSSQKGQRLDRSGHTHLFATGELSAALDQLGRRLDEAIASLDADKLGTPDAELEDALLHDFRVEPVTLRRDDIAVRTQEEDVDISQDQDRMIRDRSRPFMVKGTRFTFFVPFDGDATLLHLRPSSFTTVFPDGRVEGSEIAVDYVRVDADAQQIRGTFASNLSLIERYLQWANGDVETFNGTLTSRIRAGLAARKAKLERDRAALDGLGYKTRTEKSASVAAVIAHAATPGPSRRTRRNPRKAARQIADVIAAGESETVEFKASLRWDFKTSQDNKALQDEVLQAIAGFLNAAGGDVVVGVADDGSVIGIEADLRLFGRGEDSYLQRIANLVADRVGPEFGGLVTVQITGLDDKRVCRVMVKGAPKPAFIDGSDFYVRVGNTTRKLDPKRTVDYVNTHWRGK